VVAPDGEAAPPAVEAVLGDITAEPVDAIVNAANAALAQGAGVCGAIFRAAGADRLTAACAALGGCAPGDAKATPGFDLAAPWIIHTVGPVWHGGGAEEDETLASCYRRSLEVADGLGLRSVAFPAISTGIYGFPPDRAAAIAVSTVRAGVTGVSRVRLVAFDPATFDRYRSLLG
jgi:O-acetyl-ADP-ribose deacetylase (regulator of RNase III)